MLDRRELIRRGLALGLAPALLPLAGGAAEAAAAEEPRVRRRVTLGRTGLEIPDIGFGSSSLAGDDGARAARARARHQLLRHGRELHGRRARRRRSAARCAGRRDEVMLASKAAARARTTSAPT